VRGSRGVCFDVQTQKKRDKVLGVWMKYDTQTSSGGIFTGIDNFRSSSGFLFFDRYRIAL